jgi:hypothetical protein
MKKRRRNSLCFMWRKTKPLPPKLAPTLQGPPACLRRVDCLMELLPSALLAAFLSLSFGGVYTSQVLCYQCIIPNPVFK